MSLYMIIGVLAIAIIVYFAFKIFKGILRTILSVLGSIIVILIVLGIIIYMDVQKVNNLMDEGDKIVLYEHNNSCITGIQLAGTGITFTGDGSFPEGVKALNAEECSAILESVQNKEMENNLVLVVNEEVFSPIEELDVYGYQIDKEQAETILLSDEPKEAIINMALEEENLSKELNDVVTEQIKGELDTISEEEVQASIFLLLSNEVLNEEGEQYLLEQVKEENIDIYPQLLIVKGIQWMPDSMFASALDKISEMRNQTENNVTNVSEES